MSESSTAPGAGATKAAWIPLEVRDLGGIATAQGGKPGSNPEAADYTIS